MKRILAYSIIIFLFTIYIYTLIFRVFPVSAKYFLEIFGLIGSIKYFSSKHYRLKNSIKWIFRFSIVIVLWDIVVSLFNGTSQFVLAKSIITPIGSVFGAQFLYSCSKKYIIDHHDFLLVVIYTVFIESLITVLIKFVPPIYDFFEAIQITQTQDAEINDLATYHRFIGIGNGLFFAALPSIAIGLLSTVYELHYTQKSLKRIFLFFSLLFVSLVGFLVVRTSLFIVALSVLLLLLYSRKERFSKTIGGFMVITIFIVIIYNLALSFLDETILKWGFDFLVNRDVSDQNDSAYTVIEWWKNVHFDFKTLIIGDGLYTNPNGPGYYMGTDIGFFRRIFYGGIIGLGIILYYHAKILKYIYLQQRTQEIKLLMLFIFASYLVILAKGDMTILSHVILFLVFFERGIFYKVNNNQAK